MKIFENAELFYNIFYQTLLEDRENASKSVPTGAEREISHRYMVDGVEHTLLIAFQYDNYGFGFLEAVQGRSLNNLWQGDKARFLKLTFDVGGQFYFRTVYNMGFKDNSFKREVVKDRYHWQNFRMRKKATPESIEHHMMMILLTLELS